MNPLKHALVTGILIIVSPLAIAPSVVEEPQSETDSVDYESTDSTDEGGLVESSSISSPGGYGSPQTPKANHASGVASSRGLNIQVSNRGNRHSRIMGLPGSPRPPLSPDHEQPDNVLSPMQTPK